MTLDPQARIVLDAQAGAPGPGELPVEEVRAAYLASIPALFGPVDDVASAADIDAGGVPARVYRPDGAEDRAGALVYFHGGGWVVGDIDTHDPICRALAARAGCVVVSVGYRLAPEHRFPAAIDDAWDATRWVAAHADELGIDPARIGVGGDSAGANLATVVARRARSAGPKLAFQLLVYPVTDHGADSGSLAELAEGYGLTRASMDWYWQQYLASPEDGANPDASPLQAADLSGLPPALLITAGFDPLRDQGEEYAARLTAAGVPTTHVCYEGLFHGFMRMPAAIDAAATALDETAAALREALGSRS